MIKNEILYSNPAITNTGSTCVQPSTKAQSRIVSLTGLTDYTDALAMQYAAQAAVQSGNMANTLYLLEHRPVVTIGRGAGRGDKDLITGRDRLMSRSIQVIDSDRGGDTTYHGPGQLVGYSIVDLETFGRDLHRYIRSLERLVADALSDFSIEPHTIPGLTGVWVEDAKIAAIGIKVSRWVSLHGFSINIDADLGVMRNDIVPCGIIDKGVTSMRELGIVATRSALEASVARHWSKLFGKPASAHVKQTNVGLEKRILGKLSGESAYRSRSKA